MFLDKQVIQIYSPAQTLQVIYMRLTYDWTFELVVMACNTIKSQHAEFYLRSFHYSANFHRIFKWFSLLFSKPPHLSNDSSYNMMLFLVAIASSSSQVNIADAPLQVQVMPDIARVIIASKCFSSCSVVSKSEAKRAFTYTVWQGT